MGNGNFAPPPPYQIDSLQQIPSEVVTLLRRTYVSFFQDSHTSHNPKRILLHSDSKDAEPHKDFPVLGQKMKY